MSHSRLVPQFTDEMTAFIFTLSCSVVNLTPKVFADGKYCLNITVWTQPSDAFNNGKNFSCKGISVTKQ